MNEIRQARVIDEIISSEQSYLEQLDKLQNFFCKPIYEKGFLPTNVHAVVFSQLSTICQMNTKLLEELSNGRKENVGQAFIRLGPFLKAYSSYANNFQKGVSLLQEWQSRNEDFKSFVMSTESRPEVQSKLTALLIAPIQRIPRYRLLLEELMKFVCSSCSWYSDIKDAHALICDVAHHIDKSVDDAHILQRLLVLQKALKNQQPNIIAPGRRLLKEGILNKVSRKGKGSQERMFFLFSDMIMYAKVPLQLPSSASKTDLVLTVEYDLKPNSLECCCLLPLRYCRVATVFGSNEHGITFRLQCSDEDLVLYSRNSIEGQEWISLIKEAAQQALQKRKTLRKASSKRKAIRRTALQKFSFSDDDENTTTSGSQNSMGSKSPCSMGNFKYDLLKSQICKLKDCLTPPKIWLTPKKKSKNEVSKIEESSLEKEAHESSDSMNNSSSPKYLNRTPKLSHLTYQNFAKGSPHGISPLAICSNNGTDFKVNVNNDFKSDFRNCYHLRNSVTLRNKAKAGFSGNSERNGSPSFTNAKNILKKKRPSSEIITPKKVKNKKAKQK